MIAVGLHQTGLALGVWVLSRSNMTIGGLQLQRGSTGILLLNSPYLGKRRRENTKQQGTSLLRVLHEKIWIVSTKRLFYNEKSVAGLRLGFGLDEDSIMNRFVTPCVTRAEPRSLHTEREKPLRRDSSINSQQRPSTKVHLDLGCS